MKAIIATRYGTPDVLRLEEVEKPTPQDDEVLIRIQAASMNAANVHFLAGKSLLVRLMAGGLSRPKQPIPGSDFAGRVEAVGRNVTRFQPGDDVFGDLSDSGGGTFAEYVAAPEHVLVRKPAAMSFEDAAAIPLAGVTALQGLRDYARVQPGQRVLVNGASGGVGSFAVQLAKAYGAEVTAVASTRKLDMLRSVGADRVIDNTREDFTRNGERYDLIFDVAAYRPFGDVRSGRWLYRPNSPVHAGRPGAFQNWSQQDGEFYGPVKGRRSGIPGITLRSR
jgi:NADPH:quinone reductase-like Zn-dependent oxidoreductase